MNEIILKGLQEGVLHSFDQIDFKANTPFTFDLETTGLEDNCQILLIGIRYEKQDYLIPYELLDREVFEDMLVNCSYIIIHNAMFDLNLLNIAGFKFTENIFCTQIASWVEDENQSHKLIDLAKNKFKVDITEYKNFKNPDIIELAQHCKRQLAVTERLFDFYKEKLPHDKLKFEFNLIPVLLSAQRYGMYVDKNKLEVLDKEYKEEVIRLEEKALEVCPNKIDINSPAQLSKMFFEVMGLTPVKKTKKGNKNSTDTEVLHTLKNQGVELAIRILDYREKVKTLNTFITPVKERVGEDSRIHPHFNITGTRVGRLSAERPNTQQITKKEDRIREMYIAPEGHKLLVIDYSQMHLRILAHMAQEKVFLKAFSENGDIHKLTAKLTFGKEDINESERDFAKILNFGIIYGLSTKGLVRELRPYRPELTEEQLLPEAERIYNNFKESYKNVFYFKKKVLECFHKNNYVITLFNRKRHLEWLPNVKDGYKAFLDREAFNSVIVGSEADIAKNALIKLYPLVKENKIHIINQVHDEIVIEVEEALLNDELLKEIKNKVDYPLDDINICAEIKVCSNWAEKKNKELLWEESNEI
jgi:DNA polymerase-1